MHHYLTMFVTLCALLTTACVKQNEALVFSLPPALTQPEPVPSLKADTVKGLATAAIRTRGALVNANEKLTTIDCLYQAHIAREEAACKAPE